jgi:hypothetical protein
MAHARATAVFDPIIRWRDRAGRPRTLLQRITPNVLIFDSLSKAVG